MRKNKSLIIVITIILILALAGGILAYLYIATDIFKSNQELFAKYFLQNTETFKKITDFQTIKVYENLKNENKFESNTTIKMLHSEGGEVSNTLNNLSAKIDIQKNADEQYVYGDAKILYEEEEYLETEILKEGEKYGIRFSDVVKQFVMVEKGENTEAVSKDLGMTEEQLQLLINIIDGVEEISAKEQIHVLKDKYIDLITKTILNGAFEKQKKAIITYNGVTTETNAYSVSLTSEQLKNVLIEILENIKNENQIWENTENIINKEDIVEQINNLIEELKVETEVLTIKITVYEQQKNTIRTIFEIGEYKFSIENMNNNEQSISKINYTNLNDEEEIKYDVTITKKNLENQENLEVIIDVTEGEETYTISFLNNMQVLNSEIQHNVELSHKQDIITQSVLVENKIKTGHDFEKIETLVSGNNITISSLKESKRKELINLLKQIVPSKMGERIELLVQKVMNIGETTENEQQGNAEQEPELSQVEVNKFNAKFEFFTGDEVSAENVKKLLDIVKNNLKTVEEEAQETEKDAKINMNLFIEKDKVNEEAITNILEKIENNKKYKVVIKYKESNGLIDCITITEK